MRTQSALRCGIAALILSTSLCSAQQNQSPPAKPHAAGSQSKATVRSQRPNTTPDARTGSCDTSLEIALSPADNTPNPPAELLLSDAHGNTTGTNPATGKIVEDIPRSSYDEGAADDDENGPEGPTIRTLTVCNAAAGTYQLKVFGTAAGKYDLAISAASGDWEPSIVVKPGLDAAKDATREFSIKYTNSPEPAVEVEQAK